jgi:hypothetical protein
MAESKAVASSAPRLLPYWPQLSNTTWRVEKGAAPVVRLARSLYLMCTKCTLAQSTTLKKELQEKMAKAATPVDDEMPVQLAAKHTGRLFYDYEWDKITYRIEDIKYVANKRNINPPCWEAECIPVELTAEGWSVPYKDLVYD